MTARKTKTKQQPTESKDADQALRRPEVLDRPIFFTGYPDPYDNCIHDNLRYQMTWGEFVEYILDTRHTEVRKKDDAPLIAPVRFLKALDPTCHPALRTAREAEIGMGEKGERKLDKLGRPYTGRYALNVESWSMLPVDIDGQQTIDKAREFFREFTHIGYTSFNHLHDGKTHKFRLFLLLEQPVSHATLTARIPSLKKWLGNVDLSSLAGARGFYLASCPPERKKLAKVWYEEGSRCLDILSFDPAPTEMPRVIPKFSSPTLDAGDEKYERRALLEMLRAHYLGNYEDWWKVSSAMLAAGFTLEDFKYVTLGGMMSRKDERDCEAQWEKVSARHERGNSIHPGYLYNLVGGGRAIKKLATELEIAELKELLGETP